MKKKILIVEDDKELRENLFTLLDEEGYQVYKAVDGEDALEIAKNNHVDLVICDIMLPGIDGYKVLEKMKNMNVTSSIPFIFLSAKAEKTDLRKGMELGADDYIFKPFKLANLLNSIETRLNRFEIIKKSSERENEIVNDDYSLDDRIFISNKYGAQFIKVNDIRYISADNQYSILHVDNVEKHLFRRSLNNWERVLPNKDFIRIHRSTIINLNYLTNLEKWFNNRHRVRLDGITVQLDVSKRYIAKIKSQNK